MAQKVKVTILCDVCSKNDEVAEATYSEVITFGSITRLLELCEPHQEEIIGNLPDILQLVGQKPSAQRPFKRTNLDEGYPCNEKDCGRKFTTPQGLASHLRLAHGIRKAQRESTNAGKKR